ncbi:MAG: pyridoxal 5'-phosphate synthase glutaminase subunit PdxT [Chloroflexi bacterium]|nr:pyridoxal 5'-phosphate synthase glutaminase subunit PdxT [Chloroflexota bacterium]
MKIGVLAAQGAFAEHIHALHRLGIEAVPVRLPGELAGLDGLIIPGGESTSICRLLEDFKLKDKITELAGSGFPVFGTCAGMIVLAQKTPGAYPEPLGVMSLKVKRNALGRQRESFETELSIAALGDKPFPAVFIRAPVIEQVNGRTEILARLPDGTIVAARQGKMLVAAFHPELTDDLRFHQYFIDIIKGKQ